jgi:universal stress protein A
MQTYTKILAAVDYSEHADSVVQRAVSLAQQYAAALAVLHVVDYAWPTDTDYVLAPIDDMEDKLVDAAQKRLDSLLESTGTPAAERIVVVGRPKQEILQVAEREQADLIVLGAHGHHGLAGFLGSTADRVLHRASCDVLAVR